MVIYVLYITPDGVGIWLSGGKMSDPGGVRIWLSGVTRANPPVIVPRLTVAFKEGLYDTINKYFDEPPGMRIDSGTPIRPDHPPCLPVSAPGCSMPTSHLLAKFKPIKYYKEIH